VKAVKIADLKNNLSRHLARVRRGGEVTVYDRGTPIARIVPFVPGDSRPSQAADTAGKQARARVADLVRQGILSPGDPRAVAGWLDDHEPIRLPDGSPGAVDVLLDMRRESTR
jgi:prevent-host-death family protein